MTWVATAGTTSYPIIDPQITKRLEGANTASFQCMANIPVGTVITIKYNGTTVYYGKVRSIRRRSDNLNTVELMEPAGDLKLFRLEDGGSGIVTIDNPNGTRYLSSYISSILNGTGWTGSTTEDTNRIPGTSDPLPPVRFYNSTVAKALEKMITLVCGYKMWFHNEQKIVKYGNMNVDRSGTAIPAINVRPISSDINYGVDRVIVIGKTEDIYGEAIKSGATTPYKTLMYQYSECTDSTEARSIAKQILADRSILMERFECDILPGNYIYEEGDLVRISDAKTGTYGIYGIKDISISTEKTTLGLGCSEITIFDLLGDKLTEISGSSFNGVESNWNGGEQNIGTSTPARFNIYISDVSRIDSFLLELKFNKWKKSLSTEYGTGTGSNQFLSAEVGSDISLTGISGANGNVSKALFDISQATGSNTDAFIPYSYITRKSGVNNENVGYINKSPNWTWAPSTNTGIELWPGGINGGFDFALLTVLLHFFNKDTVKHHVDINPRITAEYWGEYVELLYEAEPYGGRINVRPMGLNGEIVVPLTYLIPGYHSTCNTKFQIGFSTDAGPSLVYYGGMSWYVQIMRKHSHTFEPNYHGHSKSESNHTHSITDNSHDHYTSIDHNHNFYPNSHNHTNTNNLSEVGTGPSNVVLKINNNTVQSGIAGGVSTYTKLITPYLQNGNNEIIIESASIGSVYAQGSYINYGV